MSSYLIIPVIFITAKSFSPFLKSPTWLPTKFPTFTSALRHITATLPPHYRQKEICTDIYTDKTAATFRVHRPTTEVITFPKISQKRPVYTLIIYRNPWGKWWGLQIPGVIGRTFFNDGFLLENLGCTRHFSNKLELLSFARDLQIRRNA